MLKREQAQEKFNCSAEWASNDRQDTGLGCNEPRQLGLAGQLANEVPARNDQATPLAQLAPRE